MLVKDKKAPRRHSSFPKDGRSNTPAAAQRNLQKIQNRPDGALVILAQAFVLDSERFDSCPLKKVFPRLLLFLAVSETLFDQVGIESRLLPDILALLYFPKIGLGGARFR